MTAPRSLRRWLIGSTLAASALLWLVSLGIVVAVAWSETSEVFDDALEQGAELLLATAAADSLSAGPAVRRDDDRESDGGRAAPRIEIDYQIVANGRVLSRGEDAPATPFVPAFEQRKGFRNVVVDGKPWRVYVLRAGPPGVQVQVGQPWPERLDLLSDLAGNLVWPALGLLALLGLVNWFVIRRLLAPLERSVGLIAAKSAEDLAPLSAAGQPAEMQPVLGAVNALLARLGQSLQAERRFTADAAHELRTPLAALRMKLQLLQRRHPEQREALGELRDDIDRSAALVDNLLALARLDPQQPQGLSREPVALAPLFDGLAQAHAAAARERGAGLQVDVRVDSVFANPELLQAALRNLVDNALRYGGSGGTVRLDALPGPRGGVRLAVRDAGPGVPPETRGRLAERFYRVLGSGEPGSGLGLSIVARVAALHGATLGFEEGLQGRGLGVVIDFPAR